MAWFIDVTSMIGARRVTAPRPMPEASGPRVLTMEYIDGATIDDLGAVAVGEFDTREAVKTLIEAWFALALCTGVFHGDMHAGNLLLRRDGTVVLLDWGIVGRLPESSRRFFRRSLEGALGDESAWPDVRDHFMATLPAEALAVMGITPDMVMEMVRAQTLMIMTSPFNELNLMMLTPSGQMPDPTGEVAPLPSSPAGWIKLIRAERKRIKETGVDLATVQASPPRGEMLLIKQLVFFERYGKLFLADEPLIYNPDVYRTLLALPDLDAAGQMSSGIAPIEIS
jgi:hypothetical protein